MTKILYIPNGEYLHFNIQGRASSENPANRTRVIERSVWYHNETRDFYNRFFKALIDDDADCHDFKQFNNLPSNLTLEEFEIVND
jgi:hypothetical protein